MAVFAESLEGRCQVENEDVVGAAPTGDAPTTSEWSTILLPTKVRLILEVLRKVEIHSLTNEMEYQFHPTLYDRCNYVSMLGWKSNHVSKTPGAQCILYRWLSPEMIEWNSTLQWVSVYEACIGITSLLKTERRVQELCPDSKVHGANMGPIWGRQDPGGPHIGPMDFALWVVMWII